jgi:hypothetical protein
VVDTAKTGKQNIKSLENELEERMGEMISMKQKQESDQAPLKD